MKKTYTLLLALIMISTVANSQTIFAIQTPGAMGDTSALFGTSVNTDGIVTAVRSNGYYIQDGAGAWNGVFVFDTGNTPSIGDDLSITADVDEYFNMTELKNVTAFVINSSGNTLPAATALSTLAVNDEQYEGVLVSVSTAQSMGAPNGFGEWDVDDGSGVITIDDGMFAFSPVVSNNYDVTGVVDYAFGIFKIEPRDAADVVGTAGGPTLTNIYDIQYTTAPSGDSPMNGNIVTTRGVVTGIVTFGTAKHSFFIQDSAAAWNGLYVYETNDSTLVIGDSVEVTGTVDEFNGTTELISVSNITVLNSGNTLPSPVSNSTLASNSEEWEGVLIGSSGMPLCTSNSIGFGMWEIDDGSGVLLADDDIYPYALSAIVGNCYWVTGIGHYSFGDFKILPRDMNDISICSSVEEVEGSSVLIYPNPAQNVLTFEMEINEGVINIIDITGKKLITQKINGFLTNVSLNNILNGIYFYSITDFNGNLIATNKFIVAK